MKKCFFVLVLFFMLGMANKGYSWLRVEAIGAAYTNFDPSGVTVSSTTATLIFSADSTIVLERIYNGTGGILYIGDSATVTNSTFTAAGGWPIAAGASLTLAEPDVFQGTLYGILAAGTTSAFLKTVIEKR